MVLVVLARLCSCSSDTNLRIVRRDAERRRLTWPPLLRNHESTLPVREMGHVLASLARLSISWEDALGSGMARGLGAPSAMSAEEGEHMVFVPPTVSGGG